MSPADHSYLYYVTGDDGVTRFAETLAGHEENIRQLRGERRMSARGIGGSTRLAGVIGDPIRHSRSPAIHNAAFAAAGLDWVFVAFQVPRGDGAAALEAMRTLGLGGLSVTMPHKQDAAWACDELTPDAARSAR